MAIRCKYTMNNVISDYNVSIGVGDDTGILLAETLYTSQRIFRVRRRTQLYPRGALDEFGQKNKCISEGRGE